MLGESKYNIRRPNQVLFGGGFAKKGETRPNMSGHRIKWSDKSGQKWKRLARERVVDQDCQKKR